MAINSSSISSSADNSAVVPRLPASIKGLLFGEWGSIATSSSIKDFIAFLDINKSYQYDVDTTFQALLFLLVFLAIQIKIIQSFYNRNLGSKKDDNMKTTPTKKPISINRLQKKFLAVFWLMRISFWMSGPYFYAAYASKRVGGDDDGGQPLSMAMISYISLSGYASIALLGPIAGKLTNQYGSKSGTIVACLLYAIGNWTIVFDSLPILFVGRAISGLGTCLMGSAPEAWIVSQLKQNDIDPTGIYLRETFGRAYALDSVIAIGAGQIAGWAATYVDSPTGPFRLSPFFLGVAIAVTVLCWTTYLSSTTSIKKETRTTAALSIAKNSNIGHAEKSTSEGEKQQRSPKQPSVSDAIQIIRTDLKILYLGGVQASFEGAMCIMVLQWCPTMRAAIQNYYHGDSESSTEVPYGTIFSCFMACCTVGSSIFGWLTTKMKTETSFVLLLIVSTISMILAAFAINTDNTSRHNELWLLTLSYFVFEGCVGVYFPSIGTLRGKYLPDSHRSLIMTLYGVPLNILVVTVYLLQNRLGSMGSLIVASFALAVGSLCMVMLNITVTREDQAIKKQKTVEMFKTTVTKVEKMNMVTHAFATGSRRNDKVRNVSKEVWRQRQRELSKQSIRSSLTMSPIEANFFLDDGMFDL